MIKKSNSHRQIAPKQAPPDRSRLDRAEAALSAVMKEEARALETLERRKRQLEGEIEDVKAGFAKRRREGEQQLANAQRAYDIAMERA